MPVQVLAPGWRRLWSGAAEKPLMAPWCSTSAMCAPAYPRCSRILGSCPFELCCLTLHKEILSACVLCGHASTALLTIVHTTCMDEVLTGLSLPAQKAKNCTATHKERGSQSESKTSRVGAPFH